MSEQREIWRGIPETEGRYEISNHGRLWHVRLNRIVAGMVNKDGFRVVSLGSPKKTLAVHRLVALAFLGPAPPGHYATHKSDDRLDNLAENLEWKTMREIARRHAQHGEANPRAKLTEADVREIRRRVADGATRKEVSREFGIKAATVRQIVRRETWKHVE